MKNRTDLQLIEAARGGDRDARANEAAGVLLDGCLFAQEMKVIKSWNYAGKGVMLGEKDLPRK
ncbi:MAG: hypothetical protein KAU49_02715 [Candidatus Krumholzibacteria bacterium]|nr:hypothetical protein [Candidatus Krumholzibacteria bacterium]